MARCLSCCAAVIVFAAACASETETPPRSEPPPSPAATQASNIGSGAGNSSPAPAVDPFAAEYAELTDRLDRWDGDETVVSDARVRAMAMVTKDRGYAPAYVLLARCEALAGTGNDESSLPDGRARAWRLLHRALTLAPDNFDAHLGAAWLARGDGDFDKAEESLRLAEALKPGDAEVKAVRVAIAYNEQDPQRTVRLARELLNESQDASARFYAYRYLMEVYEDGLHLDEADGVYREMLQLRPESSWIRSRYAGFLLYRDDVEGAIREGEKALSIRRHPLGLLTLAGAYLRKGKEQWDANRISDSAASIQKMVNLAGDNPDLMVSLGQFYEGAALRSRDATLRKKALDAYRKALELNPRHMEAERSVARLAKAFG